MKGLVVAICFLTCLSISVAFYERESEKRGQCDCAECAMRGCSDKAFQCIDCGDFRRQCAECRPKRSLLERLRRILERRRAAELYEEKRASNRNCNQGDIASYANGNLMGKVAWGRKNGICRAAVKEVASIEDAERVCASWDMELAKITDDEDYVDLQDFINYHNSETSAKYNGIGLRYIDGEWRYPTDQGKVSTFIPWDSGYPKNVGERDCTMLVYEHGWGVRNEVCTSKSYFVCQRDDN